MIIIDETKQIIKNIEFDKKIGLPLIILSIPLHTILVIFFDIISTEISIVLYISQFILLIYFSYTVRYDFYPQMNKFYIRKKVCGINFKRIDEKFNYYHSIRSIETKGTHRLGYNYKYYIIYIEGDKYSHELGTVESKEGLEKIKRFSETLNLKFIS